MNEIEKAQQEITEARDKLASAEARLSALSKPEKEYRAGEWVPRYEADKATKDDAIRLLSTRQFTEQELKEWFDNRPLVQDEIDALLHEVVPGENEAWYSVLKFAAHVGALKAEP